MPQTLVSTGASYWGTQYKEFPWTIGWQPDYIAEGRIYGLHIKANHTGKKIAVIYQNDDYGKDYLLRPPGRAREELRRSEHRRHGGDRGDCDQLGVADGQDQVDPERPVLVIFQLPTPTVRSIATGKALGYNPDQIYMNSVSAFRTPMDGAVASAGAAVRQRDPLGRVPEGLGQPEVGQRRGDEAVPHDRGEVPARTELQRRSDLLRRGESRDVRAGAVQGRKEPDPRGSHERAPELELGEQVRAPGRHAEDHEERTTGSSARCSSSGSTRTTRSGCRSAG